VAEEDAGGGGERGVEAARGEGEAHDPETQPERTRLAWRRTTLTFALVVVLAVREVVVLEDSRTGLAFMAVSLDALAWVAFLILTHRRIRALAASESPPPVTEATILGAAGVVALTAMLGLALLTAEA
jgi:hypothetical protein